MTRRSRGAGSVRYNVSRGRYEAVIVIGGVKHTKTVPSPEPNERRKKEAEKAVEALQRQFAPHARRLTVSAFLAEWLEHIEPGLAYGTWEGHAGRVRNHINPALGKLPIEALSTRHIDNLWSALIRKKLAPSTIGLVRKTLSNALNRAVDWDLITKNPVPRARAPRIPNVERKTLAPVEALRFLESVSGDRLDALWNLAACLGLRSGEVRGLTWEAITLPRLGAPALSDEPPVTGAATRANHRASGATTLRVTESLGYRPGQWDLHEPKTPRSRRTLALPPFITDLLELRRDAQRFEAQSLAYSNPMGLVFTTPDGYPLSSQWLNERLKVLLGEAGLPRVTVHDLRHAAASLLLARGGGVRAVQDALGHATAQMTLGVYAASDDAQRRDLADRLEVWRAQ